MSFKKKGDRAVEFMIAQYFIVVVPHRSPSGVLEVPKAYPANLFGYRNYFDYICSQESKTDQLRRGAYPWFALPVMLERWTAMDRFELQPQRICTTRATVTQLISFQRWYRNLRQGYNLTYEMMPNSVKNNMGELLIW